MRKADVILKSSAIFTGGNDKTISGIVSIVGQKIQYVGSASMEVELTDEHTKRFDLGDQLIIPGLHDAHLHFYMSALYDSPYVHVCFTDRSEEQCAAGLKEIAGQVSRDRWLIGAGWYHPLWVNPVLPTRKSLDAVYPDRPVCMVSGDCHTLWFNTAGLEQLGLTKDRIPAGTPHYDFDENGELTGIIHESAAAALTHRIYEFTEEEENHFYRDFMKKLNSFGITSVCDMSMMSLPGADFVRNDIYGRLLNQGELTVRVHMFPTLFEDLSRPLELKDQLQGDMLQCCGVKHFFDGVSSCHTAYLKEPYANPYFEGDCGNPVFDPERMRELVLKAHQNNLSVRVHTIGDQAIHLLLDYYEEAANTYGRKPWLRHTLEHLEDFQEEDIKRMEELGVVASVQPAHALIDVNGVERDMGPERINLMWPFRRMLDEGVILAFGTDCPVVDINPFYGLYNAVTRQSAYDQKPKGGWIPKQRIKVSEALNAYTYGSAHAVCRQQEIGTIAPGMYADIAVLDQNILEGEPEKILKTNVTMTIVSGKIVFEKQEEK